MQSTRRISSSLLFAPLLALCASPAPAVQTQDAQIELYNDPQEFAKLSSAAQNLLVAKFGPRPAYDEKGNLLHPYVPPNIPRKVRRDHLDDLSPQSLLGNVLVNDPSADATPQDTQSETALVLGSGSKVIAGFNDSGSFLGGSSRFTGWAHSSDAGATWTDPGVLPGNNDAGDPVLARNTTTGRIYLGCLFFNGSGINVLRSDDDGVSWQNPVNGAPTAGGFQDKAWLTVDNFAGAGNGNVYLVSRDFGAANGIFLFRSTDQGATFGPANGLLIASGAAGNVQGAYVLVGPDHSVYALWFDSSVVPAQIRVRRSTDLGLTFGPPVTVTTLTSTAVNGNLSLVAGFRSNSFIQGAVNPISGNIYIVYNDPAAESGGDRGNIKLRQSTDSGATWSPAIQVNDDATTRAQYFPGIAVRPDGTGMAVCWYDNRNDPADRNIQRWGATATISGGTITFGPNFRISAEFPPLFGVDPVVNTVYMGDYDQMAADNSLYYTTWGDNRDDSTAVPGRKNANVRFTSFSQEGPGAIVDLGERTVTGGNLNGRVEQNECNELFVTLSNSGGQPATGISAVLSTVTPNVTILDAVQPYPDLLPGDSATNVGAFRVSTSPAFNCGASIQFTLTVSSSAGVGAMPFSLETGGGDYVVQVDSGKLSVGGTDIGNHGDDTATAVLLPFPVTYYTSVFNSITCSSNGNVQFAGSNTAFTNDCLPAATMSELIALHWDDLRTDGGAGFGIFQSVVGAAPNRTFRLRWRATYFSGAGTANFELRLHEDSSSFDVIYGQVDQAAASATIGCQKGTGATSFTSFACNQSGSIGTGTKLTFSLPGCPDGGGECAQGGCFTLDFETEDDFATPLGNGQAIDTEFGNLVTISGAGSNLGPTTFDSTPGGPNDPALNDDMLIGHGNLLLLQSDTLPTQTVPGFFDSITDDADGGDMIFDFVRPVNPQSVLLADINPPPNLGASVTLTDGNGAQRVYAIPPGWTGTYGDAGPFQLDLTTAAAQVGAGPWFRIATAVEDPGFVQTGVTQIVVHMTGFGAMDELSICR